MQYTSRIYFRFKDKESWKTVLNEIKVEANGKKRTLLSFKDDFAGGFSYFANGIHVNEDTLSCEISDFIDDDETLDLVRRVEPVVGESGIIIADTFSYSGDPICFELYYFGKEIHSDVRFRAAEKHFDIPINDVEKWLGATRKKGLTAEEKSLLKECL